MSSTLVKREHIHLRGGIDSINTIKPIRVNVPKNVADSIKLPAKNEIRIIPTNIRAPFAEFFISLNLS